MGPFSVMNEGTVLRAPKAVAMATCGLTVPERTANGRLEVAAAAAVQIETGPEPITNALGLVEILEADVEDDLFVCGQAGERCSRTRGTALQAGVGLGECRG